MSCFGIGRLPFTLTIQLVPDLRSYILLDFRKEGIPLSIIIFDFCWISTVRQFGTVLFWVLIQCWELRRRVLFLVIVIGVIGRAHAHAWLLFSFMSGDFL
uniref:Uncharacterized protein n=1 Tax=Cacopsylla melanoneura TaxID=428564 RepID=A0A8D8TKY7_9HEMI